MSNKGKKLNLTKRYLDSTIKESKDDKKFTSKCIDCKTVFIGTTQDEANKKNYDHDCPKRKKI